MNGLRLAMVIAAWLAVMMSSPARAGEGDSLVQFSTIDALLSGLYDGVTEVGAVRRSGDLGLGTFDGLDGEMVVLDGQVYRIGADGLARPVSDHETTPFATVTFFRPDGTLALPEGTDYDAFQKRVDAALPSANLFYALRAEGRFKSIRTRSVPKQGKPYRPLVEVVKDQSVFDFTDVDGVLLGFYSPAFAKGVNSPGYHLHFLTADKRAGGHVLAFTVEHADLAIDSLSRLRLDLPTSKGFAAADLSRDRQGELDQVERQR